MADVESRSIEGEVIPPDQPLRAIHIEGRTLAKGRGWRTNTVVVPRRTMKALRLIALNANTVKDAATASGMTTGALYDALRKPELQALVREMTNAKAVALRAQAFGSAQELMLESASQRVRLEATRLLLEETREVESTGVGDIELHLHFVT